MNSIGLTKARSMGPLADAVERAGGSVTRVFREAELPLRLVEQPERLILLRDQLRLVECAAREIGDEALPARLAREAGMASLGGFGAHVCAAPRLGDAIARCNSGIASMLQSVTRLGLARSGPWAKWTYGITDSTRIGRQKNEMLALGYMIDLLRRFAGRAAIPVRAELPGRLHARTAVQDLLGCEVVEGAVAAVIFPCDRLALANPTLPEIETGAAAGAIPGPADFAACVEHLVLLELLDRRPHIDWVCRRLGMSKRSLQRRLALSETSFDGIRRRVLFQQASTLLCSPGMAVTDIAFELGYDDPAHFTRAFARWTGLSPRSWRRKMTGRDEGRPAGAGTRP
jgi:AraC-like DNA-binding protein